MSTTTAAEPEPAAPALVASGVPLGVFAFGFSVLMLGLANAELFNVNASLFVPVAFGTGALGMLVAGLMEFRNSNLFGATFCLSYACFLFTTPLILRWFAPEISLDRVAGVGGFGDSFGAYLLVWAVFTAFFTFGAYYVNLPAFLAFLLLAIVYVLGGDRQHHVAVEQLPAQPVGLGRDRRRDLRVVGRIRAGAERHGPAPDHPDAQHPRQPLKEGGERCPRSHSPSTSRSRWPTRRCRATTAGTQTSQPRLGAPGERLPRRVPRVDGRADRQQRLGQRRPRRDLASAHMLSGPIAVEGAEPGDLLAVEILDLGPCQPPQEYGDAPGQGWGYTGIFAHT